MSDVTVSFLDVGQGDCTVVVDHATLSAMLIDCPSGSEAKAIDEIRKHGAKLDTVVVTHSHLDHLGGVLDAVETLGCRRLLYNHDTFTARPPYVDRRGRARPDPAVVASLRRIMELGADQLGAATPGSVAGIGVVTCSFLAPIHRDLTRAVVSGNANAGSGVLLITVDEVSILVAGDADAEVWMRLLSEPDLPRVAVARWPHHGGELDTNAPGLTAALVERLDAAIIVVSVGGRNSYEHPADSLFRCVRPHRGTLMCTQATPKCAGQNPQPCAATIRLRIIDGEMTVDPPLATHYERVNRLPSPQCQHGESVVHSLTKPLGSDG